MRLRLRQLIAGTCVVAIAVFVLAQILAAFCRNGHHRNKNAIVIDQSGHVIYKPVNNGGRKGRRSFLPSFFPDNHNEDESDEIDYETVFERRRRHAYRACRSRNRTGFERFQNAALAPYGDRQYRWMFADDVHKIVYCSVPKAASTNWKKWFVVATNSTKAASPNSLTHEYVNRDAKQIRDWPNFKPLWWFPRNESTWRLKNYKKVIWIRDPYARLVSAWRSKFFSVNRYYNKVGRTIIRWYRRNATASERNAGFPVTFEEFLTYARDEGLKGRFDVHWNVMADFCYLCDIPYDYIGHYENLLPEANYVIKKLTGRTDVPFPFKDRVKDAARPLTEANYTVFNKSVPRRLLIDTLSLYHIDYDAFGYEWPNF